MKARASEISRRVDEAQARINPQQTGAERGRTMGQGMRIAVELVVGVAVGGFVGYWLDSYFGTRPWLMIVLFILGFVAGMWNVIRTAKRMQARVEASQKAAPSVRDDDMGDN